MLSGVLAWREERVSGEDPGLQPKISPLPADSCVEGEDRKEKVDVSEKRRKGVNVYGVNLLGNDLKHRVGLLPVGDIASVQPAVAGP